MGDKICVGHRFFLLDVCYWVLTSWSLRWPFSSTKSRTRFYTSDYYEVGTAKTIKRYTLNPGGCVYGFAQLPNQAGNNRFPQESSIGNLYFASAWTEPGGGFGAALGSGYMVANKILQCEKG